MLLFCQGKRQTWYNSTLASRRKRLTAHFEDLEQCYFSNKMSRITGSYCAQFIDNGSLSSNICSLLSICSDSVRQDYSCTKEGHESGFIS